MQIEELTRMLGVTIKKNPKDTVYQGLTEQDAEDNFKKFGPNALTEKKQLPWFVKLLLCMTGLFNYVIWVGCILSFVAFGIQTDKSDKSNMYLGIILAGLVVLTGSMTYYMSSKSENLMA